MPHIDIKCYPKHLTPAQFNEFISDLTALAQKHLSARESDVSINYTEIDPDKWKALVWDNEIAPNLASLAKRPGYNL